MRPLTPREKEVLGLAATGRTNPEIAAYLGIGVDSVKHHLRGCYLKMGAKQRSQAIAAFEDNRLPGATSRPRSAAPLDSKPSGFDPALWLSVPPAARRCYQLRLSGLSNAQIAIALGIRPDTVKKHVRHAARRLGKAPELQVPGTGETPLPGSSIAHKAKR